MKKLLALALCLGLSIGTLSGCAYPMGDPALSQPESVEDVAEETLEKEDAKEEDATSEADTEKDENETLDAEAQEEDEENYETGDASLDDPLNQDDIGENELLVVSFGTSFNDSRRLTIGAIEKDLAEAFPEYSVRRAFTSQIIIDHVKDRDGEVIDNVEEALERALDNGVKNLVVQPTHLMHGFEYNDLVDELAEYSDAFDKIIISEPLLNTDEDFKTVAEAITKRTKEYDDSETAICFMGHGTEADSNEVYAKMQTVLSDAGFDNYFVGTVEAEPSLDDVLEMVGACGYKKAVLEPLMVVAGDHANNDMAGDDEDSWKSAFEAAGYETECLIEGLGQNEDVRKIYVEHCREAIEKAGMIAGKADMTTVEDVMEAGMEPVSASDIEKGTYQVEVDSSSSMFRITECELTVDDEGMTAVMTMGGKGYLYVYEGTSEEAVKASEEDYIPFEEKEGVHTFTVNLEALDAPFELAAFSKNKEMWYDRTLVIRADSLPEGAIKNSKTEAIADTIKRLGLKDGEYEAEVELEGGSGRASVESPAKLTVKGGEVTAEIIFSSPNYDFMTVDGGKYLPVNTEGNSTFEIPVSGFDKKMPVTADTTAMSKPHEIEYTLYFDSETIKKK